MRFTINHRPDFEIDAPTLAKRNGSLSHCESLDYIADGEIFLSRETSHRHLGIVSYLEVCERNLHDN